MKTLHIYSFWIIVFFLLMRHNTSAQFKRLHVGDTCPNFEIKHFLNFPQNEVHLSDFEGKLLLIDFWSTWCSSCIGAMPKMEQLQKQYSDSIQILLVTAQNKSKILEFRRNNKILRNISLPIVFGDTILGEFFPHSGVPHEVWIDGKGIVRAITSAQYVKAKNIRALLAGKKVNWPVKTVMNTEFNYDQPFLAAAANAGVKPDRYYYSTLTSYLKTNIRPQYGFYKDSGFVRLFMINTPIIQLYNITLKYTEMYGKPNRIIVYTSDSSHFFYNVNKNYYVPWHSKNAYCYEAILPPGTTEKKALRFMRQDINKFLNLNSHIESRVVPCLLLTKILDTLPITAYSASNKKSTTYTISGFVNALNTIGKIPPVFIDKKIKGKLKLRVNSTSVSFWRNFPEIRRAIRPFGYDLKPFTKKISMFVIRENKSL